VPDGAATDAIHRNAVTGPGSPPGPAAKAGFGYQTAPSQRQRKPGWYRGSPRSFPNRKANRIPLDRLRIACEALSTLAEAGFVRTHVMGRWQEECDLLESYATAQLGGSRRKRLAGRMTAATREMTRIADKASDEAIAARDAADDLHHRIVVLRRELRVRDDRGDDG
jgi:hypothetical protein